MNEITITFEKENNRSAAYDEGKLIGVCEYELKENDWVVYHTVVDTQYTGQGIAKRLLQSVIDNARAAKIKIIPECSYAVKVMSENPSYADVIANQ